MWTWVIIVVGYAFSLFFFRIVGGLGSAAEAIQSWGRHSAVTRLRNDGGSPRTYARSRLGS
jgi:hypothetical protein